MYKVPINVLKESLELSKMLANRYEVTLLFLEKSNNAHPVVPKLKKNLKRTKKHIKLLEDNYYV